MPSLNDQFKLLGLKIDEERQAKNLEPSQPQERVKEEYYLSQAHKNKKKVSITIDWELYERINTKAKKENRSFSSLLTYCASIGLKSLNETRLF